MKIILGKINSMTTHTHTMKDNTMKVQPGKPGTTGTCEPMHPEQGGMS